MANIDVWGDKYIFLINNFPDCSEIEKNRDE